MTKESMKNMAARKTAAGQANAERMMELSQSLLSKTMASPQKLMEANLVTGAELLQFMSRRLQAQADFWSRLAHCHEAGEAIGVQREFAAELTKDYSAEVTLLAERTAGIAQESFRNFTEQTEEVVREVASATESTRATIAEVA